MSQEMQGRVALVTGATSGIGRATARRFADAGASVAVVARNKEALARLRVEIEAKNAELLEVDADLTCPPEAEAAIAAIVARFGGFDVLVNAAGQIVNGSVENTSLADWDRMMGVNLRAVFHLMQLSVPYLEKRPGNIINVSSVTGLRAFPGVLAYCVAKAGVDQLTRCAALELAAKGIRVNAVNPGVVVTELHRRSGMSDENYADFLARSKQTHPLGRVGEPDEVAELILYLASDRASWITGVTYSIDGGRANTCAR
ncbi:MAG: glucose 1-dehydrogenase [Pyrinomonadaceae bacterium]